MIRRAVVVIDGNGEVIVLSAHRWHWWAQIKADAVRRAIDHKVPDPWLRNSVEVHIEPAGPRVLGEHLRHFVPVIGRSD